MIELQKKQSSFALPDFAELSFIYICPSCECQNWLVSKEVSIHERIVCISCETIIEIETLDNFNIGYTIKEREKSHVNPYPIIVSLGYSKDDIDKVLEENPHLKLLKDKEQIREILKKIQHVRT